MSKHDAISNIFGNYARMNGCLLKQTDDSETKERCVQNTFNAFVVAQAQISKDDTTNQNRLGYSLRKHTRKFKHKRRKNKRLNNQRYNYGRHQREQYHLARFDPYAPISFSFSHHNTNKTIDSSGTDNKNNNSNNTSKVNGKNSTKSNAPQINNDNESFDFSFNDISSLDYGLGCPSDTTDNNGIKEQNNLSQIAPVSSIDLTVVSDDDSEEIQIIDSNDNINQKSVKNCFDASSIYTPSKIPNNDSSSSISINFAGIVLQIASKVSSETKISGVMYKPDFEDRDEYINHLLNLIWIGVGKRVQYCLGMNDNLKYDPGFHHVTQIQAFDNEKLITLQSKLNRHSIFPHSSQNLGVLSSFDFVCVKNTDTGKICCGVIIESTYRYDRGIIEVATNGQNYIDSTLYVSESEIKSGNVLVIKQMCSLKQYFNLYKRIENSTLDEGNEIDFIINPKNYANVSNSSVSNKVYPNICSVLNSIHKDSLKCIGVNMLQPESRKLDDIVINIIKYQLKNIDLKILLIASNTKILNTFCERIFKHKHQRLFGVGASVATLFSNDDYNTRSSFNSYSYRYWLDKIEQSISQSMKLQNQYQHEKENNNSSNYNLDFECKVQVEKSEMESLNEMKHRLQKNKNCVKKSDYLSNVWNIIYKFSNIICVAANDEQFENIAAKIQGSNTAMVAVALDSEKISESAMFPLINLKNIQSYVLLGTAKRHPGGHQTKRKFPTYATLKDTLFDRLCIMNSQHKLTKRIATCVQ